MKTVIKHIAAASICILFVGFGSALQAKATGDEVAGAEAANKVLTAEDAELYDLLEEVIEDYDFESQEAALLPSHNIKVFNQDQELIYECKVTMGDCPDDTEGRKIMQQSELLFDFGNVKYYMHK